LALVVLLKHQALTPYFQPLPQQVAVVVLAQ
jgi:hypothetical protein